MTLKEAIDTLNREGFRLTHQDIPTSNGGGWVFLSPCGTFGVFLERNEAAESWEETVNAAIVRSKLEHCS